MTPALLSVQFFLFAGVVFLGLGCAASLFVVRHVRRTISQWEPRARHRCIIVLAALPAALAGALLLAATLPSLVALMVPSFDHCPLHDDGHAHLCFTHLPTASIGTGFVLGLVFLFTYFAIRVVMSVAGISHATRVLAVLENTGEKRSDLGVTLMEANHPVCLTVGLFRPRIVLSRALLDALSATERNVILAHEQAHVRRRDAAVQLLVRAFCTFHFPSVGRWLMKELAIAAEQICDEEAAAIGNDRLAVAAAILAVERMTQNATRMKLDCLAVGFGEVAVERRVHSLLAEASSPKPLTRIALVMTGVFVGILMFSQQLHHVTESLLSIIVH